MKKILCVLLAVLMCLSTIAMTACGNSDDVNTEGETNGADTVENTEGETKETLDIPDTRYDGEEIVFMTREDQEWTSKSIYAEQDEINQDPISDAVYTRNDMVYQKYGVTVKDYPLSINEMLAKTRNEVSAPTGDFQVIVNNVV